MALSHRDAWSTYLDAVNRDNYFTNELLAIDRDVVAGLAANAIPQCAKLGRFEALGNPMRDVLVACAGVSGLRQLSRFVRPELLGHFRLQARDVAVVTLVGDDREDIDVVLSHSLASAVHRQAHPSADLLALLDLGNGLVQRTDLEHVGIVPALTERGVREDEGHWLIERQQALFFSQNEIVGFAVSLRLSRHGVLQLGLSTNSALREIALMHGIGGHLAPG